MNLFLKYLSVFGMAALPVLELRGAVPYGVAMDLPLPTVLAVSILGNLLPVPFIILFIRQILAWMKSKSRRLRGIAEKLEARAQAKGDILVKYETLGLFILVAVPLPGTGAWTGSLISSALKLDFKKSFVAAIGGVLIASTIMTIIAYGVATVGGCR
jgi:uncharacterized membrane protein